MFCHTTERYWYVPTNKRVEMVSMLSSQAMLRWLLCCREPKVKRERNLLVFDKEIAYLRDLRAFLNGFKNRCDERTYNTSNTSVLWYGFKNTYTGKFSVRKIPWTDVFLWTPSEQVLEGGCFSFQWCCTNRDPGEKDLFEKTSYCPVVSLLPEPLFLL